MITSVTLLQATKTTENFSKDYCKDVTVIGGTNSITVGGVNAPWHRILFRRDNGSTYYDVCNDNCSDPQIISNLEAGLYIVRIEQSSGGSNDFCAKNIAAIVTDEAIDFCSDISVTGGVEEITVTGVRAPWSRIQYRLEGSDQFNDICSDNCANPQGVSGIAAGRYIVRIEQSSGGDVDYCVREIAAIVTRRAIDFCSDVLVTGGVEEITITGVRAPWNRIQYRLEGSDQFNDICNDNCANPQGVSGLAAGRYIVRIEQSSGGDVDYCVREIAAIVTSRAVDFCRDVSVIGGVEEITVTGVHAPWNRIQYRLEGSDQFNDACNDFCDNPEVISGLAAGRYIVKIEQSSGFDNYCVREIAAIVGAKSHRTIGEEATDITANLYNSAIELTEAAANSLNYTDKNFIETEVAANNINLDAKHNLASKAITLFPNPAISELNISVNTYGGQQANLVIVNQIGAVVDRRTIEALPENPLNIDVSSYANGLYFLRIQVADSDFITKRFVVRK